MTKSSSSGAKAKVFYRPIEAAIHWAGLSRFERRILDVAKGMNWLPEHAALAEAGRAEYVAASDAEALAACSMLAKTEGIIPALESSHAVAECMRRAPKMRKSDVLIVNVSGRGDKDIGILREQMKF